MIFSDSESTRAQAARIVSTGGLIAFRTDTFYGLGADPLNRPALNRIRELKSREENKPILILISDMDQLDRFVREKSGIFGLIAIGHWPAPLTLIGPSRSELPTELTAGSNTIGVRLPDDEKVRALVRTCGGEVTATEPSTVLDLSGSEPVLVREGAVSREELAPILKTVR